MAWRPHALRFISSIVLVSFFVPSVSLAAPTGVLYQSGSTYEYTAPATQTVTRAASIEAFAAAVRRLAVPVPRNELQTIPVDIPQLFLEEDRDIDGLPDVFEQQLGTNTNQDDTDNDHLTDFLEVLAGTDPLGPGSFTMNPNLTARLRGAIVVSDGVYWYIDPGQGRRIWMPLDTPQLLKTLLEPLLQPLPVTPPPAPVLPAPVKPPAPPPVTSAKPTSTKPALPPKQVVKPIPPTISTSTKPLAPKPKPTTPLKPISAKPVLPLPKPKPQAVPKPARKHAPKAPAPSPTSTKQHVLPKKPIPPSKPVPPQPLSPPQANHPESSTLTPILSPEPIPTPTPAPISTKPSTPTISSDGWRTAVQALPIVEYQRELLNNDRLRVSSDWGIYQVEAPNIGPNAEAFARFQLRKLKLDTEATRTFLGTPFSTETIIERFVIDPRAKAVGSCCGQASEALPLTWYYPTETAFLEAADLGRPEYAWILERFWDIPSGSHELVHRFVSGIQLPTLLNEGLANYIPSHIVNLGPGLECRRDGYMNGDGRVMPYQTLQDPETDRLYPSGECFWWLLDQRYGDTLMQQLLQRLHTLPPRDSLSPLSDTQVAALIMNTVIVPIVGEEARELLAAFRIPR